MRTSTPLDAHYPGIFRRWQRATGIPSGPGSRYSPFLRLLTAAVLAATLPFDGLSGGADLTPRVQAAGTVIVSESGGSTRVNESGSTDSFSVRLSDQPQTDVVLTVTSPRTDKVTAAPSQIQFTHENWNVAQFVVVSGVDNALADGDITVTIVLAAVDSLSDDEYDGTGATLAVTVIDDEPSPDPGFAVTESAGSTTVSETGTTDSFAVVLRKQPSTSVTLSVTSSDSSEVTVSPPSLTFSPGNWATAKVVTVAGVNDSLADGDQVAGVVLAVVTSTSATEYQTVPEQTVRVTTTDDEAAVPGLTLNETGGATIVGEDGTSDTFSAVLTMLPTADVVITVTAADPSEIAVVPSSLTFTPSNWDQPQLVTVTGADDTLADGDQVTGVVLSVVDGSSAAEYRDVPDQAVAVTTTDNEPAIAGMNIAESNARTVVSETATSDTFTVALSKQPTGTVVVSVLGSDASEMTVDPTSLTFTPTTWNLRQTVTVTGVDDAAADGDQISQVVLSVVDGLSAEEYRSVADRVVTVTTLDDELAVPSLVVQETENATAVTESGTTDTFTVVLGRQPSDDVVISVTGSDPSELTVSPARLTFTPSNWATPQVVTVTGVDDSLADGAQVSDVVLSVIDSLSAAEYRSIADRVVQATTLDNEPLLPALQVIESGGITVVSETGSVDSVLLALTTQPSADVTVSVTSANTAEVTVSPQRVTFTDSNWSQFQVVTVIGVGDVVVDGDQTVAVHFSVVKALSAEEYRTVSDRVVNVTNVDDDALQPPVPTSPSNNAQLDSLGPLLRWTQESGTTWFQVQVIPYNNDGPGIDLIIGDSSQVASAQYQVQEPNFGGVDANYVMLPGMTYTWRVRTAKTTAPPASTEWTAWSPSVSFKTVAKASGTIAHVGPSEDAVVASVNPTLVWTNSDPTVFYYEVQVSKNRDFNGAVFLYWELRHGGATVPPNSYSIPGMYPLERGTTYYWRVRPRVQGDGSAVAWSGVSSFRTP